jgi:hypothetical protein
MWTLGHDDEDDGYIKASVISRKEKQLMKKYALLPSTY